MMPSRFCIHYVSKSGRASSGHRTGKGQSSSQFPRRVVLKNVLIIRQLHSSPVLVKVKSLSRVWLCATPWTAGRQAPLSMGFSRQEYWSGLHFILQGIFPTQGLNPGLPHCRQMLYPLSHQGSPFPGNNSQFDSSKNFHFFLRSTD